MQTRQPSHFFPAETVSFAAFLAFLWSVLLDWHFVLDEWGLSLGQVGLAGVIYLVILAGWIWALISAAAQRRGALVGLFVYALLLAAYAVMDLVVYCPETCGRIWLYYIANWANLIFGAAAAAAAISKLRRKRTLGR
jgi:hypothetical protein